MDSIELANLHNGLGLAILVLAAAVLLTTFRWSDVAQAVRSAALPRARNVSLALGESRWSETSYGNRVAVNLVVRVEVTNHSEEPWRLAMATVRGHRALAISTRRLAPPPGSRGEDGQPTVQPGATGGIGIHCILDAAPPSDPATPFVASLVLVDQQLRESAVRLAARGPKG